MSATNYYTLTGQPAPLILAAVHDGHTVRKELSDRFNLTAQERLYEEDPHTGVWASLREPNLIGLHSRFEVDLNRSREKAVYQKPEDAWGLHVWKSPPTQEMIDGSLEAYDNFYAGVKQFLTKVVEEHGSFIVYDIHSYNHRREEDDRRPADPEKNPVINVGTRNMNRERWAPVVETFMETMRGHRVDGEPLDVRENVKFPGGYFNHWIHETFPDVSCVLSIEFKKVFMDEHSNELHQTTFQQLQDALSATFEPVLAARERVTRHANA